MPDTLTKTDARDALTELYDLRLAHNVYMDRATKQFAKRLHEPAREWAGEVANRAVAGWPNSEQLTEEQLEDRAQPVNYSIVNQGERWAEQLGKRLGEEVHAVMTQYLRALIEHEYRFQRVATRRSTSPAQAVSEAAEWADEFEAVSEMDPFEDAKMAMGQIDPPPREYVDEIFDTPSPWDGKTWNERLDHLRDSYGAGAKGKIRSKLVQGMHEGWPINRTRREVASHLGDDFAQRASMITRTETAWAQNVVKDAEFKAGAEQGIYAGKQALAVFDSRTCMQCAPLDGQTYYYDKQPNVSTAPTYPLHSNCRCMYTPIPSYADEMGLDMGPRGTKEFGPIDGDFENWMRRMNQRDSDFARNWMGEEAYKKWSQGATLSELGGAKPSSQLAMSQLDDVTDAMDQPRWKHVKDQTMREEDREDSLPEEAEEE